MSIINVLIAYGMTETSPKTFSNATSDSREVKITMIGKDFPHTQAKIVNVKGKIVPCDVRGEICTSGYALQHGYPKNKEKT
jgi:long-subunit acyl-CoA synthetase (AMP-forming)